MQAGGSGCHRRRSRQMQTKIIIIMASVEKSIATAADMTIRCNFGTFSIAIKLYVFKNAKYKLLANICLKYILTFSVNLCKTTTFWHSVLVVWRWLCVCLWGKTYYQGKQQNRPFDKNQKIL